MRDIEESVGVWVGFLGGEVGFKNTLRIERLKMVIFVYLHFIFRGFS